MAMRHSNAIERARQARRGLLLVRQRLLNPTARELESCEPHLRSAIASLERLQGELEKADSPTRSELRTELSALRSELAQVNALMHNAAAFHAILSILLTPQADDSIRYAAGGIVAVCPASTLLLEG